MGDGGVSVTPATEWRPCMDKHPVYDNSRRRSQ
jgi:hypothetical protein